MNQREAADFIYMMRPLIMEMIRTAGISGATTSAAGGGGSAYLPRDGSLAMLGTLNMGGYSITNVNLVDGVDLQSADPFPQYLTLAEASAVFVPGTRQVIAGLGLTGGGALSADITLDVGVANTGAVGLTVEANAVRLTSSSNPGAAAAVLATNASGHTQVVRLGAGVAPAYPLHARSAAGAQARLEYDATYFADLIVDSGGNLKLQPEGLLVLNAGGEAFVPIINYSGDLGLPNRKWLTLHVAELQAEILVAREKVVTIGGRFMVAAGGVLIDDFPASA